MHTMVLGLAGYGLLLSSCAALIFLLRMGCIKDILKNPLHILPTSDTLISMITSIILLLNQSTPLTKLQQGLPIAGASHISNRQLHGDDDGEKYDQNQTCMRFYYKSNDSWPNSEAFNETTSNCTFQHVLMHYAMFLVPFANAFMSLLIYSVQCSNGMSCVDKKCTNLDKVSQNEVKDVSVGVSTEQPAPPDPDSRFRKRDSGAQDDLDFISKDPRVGEQTQETILTISNDGNTSTDSNNDPKFTGFGLITQWLVPVLITAMLYLSKTQHMNNKLRESSEMECIFKINFPLESCYIAEFAKAASLRNPNEKYTESTIEVDDSDTLRISYPDSEAIDEVVSSVRNVVQSALNKTCNNLTAMNFYNSSKSWNITQYIALNNLTQEMTSDENEMFEKLTDLQQALNNKDPEFFRNNKCAVTNGSDPVTTDQGTITDEELAFFKNVVESTRTKMTSVLETKPQDSFPQGGTTAHEDTQIAEVSNTTEEIPYNNQNETALYKTNTENKTAVIPAENITGNSNDDTHVNIIKRIRDTLIQVKAKSQTENLRDNYKANREKLKTDELGSGSMKTREDRKISSTEYKGRKFSQSPIYMDDHCFLSSKFLKTHLLILLFLVYFIPVLVSGILQTRAVYMCKNILEKIDTANKNIKASQSPDVNKIKLDENSPPKPGWFFNTSDDAIRTDLSNSQAIEGPNSSANFKTPEEIANEITQQDLRLKNKKSGYETVLQETQSMEMLFTVLTRSLMLGVLMWTPAFLEILSKAFLCASTPAWLVNVLYLLGLSFGIVKNFFNVTIARINKNLNDQIYGKENSVHPSN